MSKCYLTLSWFTPKRVPVNVIAQDEPGRFVKSCSHCSGIQPQCVSVGKPVPQILRLGLNQLQYNTIYKRSLKSQRTDISKINSEGYLELEEKETKNIYNKKIIISSERVNKNYFRNVFHSSGHCDLDHQPNDH